MIDDTFKPSLHSELCPEVVTEETRALYAEFEAGTKRQLDAYFPDQGQLLAYCQMMLAGIDRQIQKIVKGKGSFSKNKRLARDWPATIDYQRHIDKEEFAISVPGHLYPNGDKLYAWLDPNWKEPFSSLRIRHLDAHVRGDNIAVNEQWQSNDSGKGGWSPAMYAFFEIDQNYLFIDDSAMRPFKNRKNKKLMEIRFKNFGGGKLDWSKVPVLAPFAIWRQAKTGPGRNKCNYRALMPRDNGRLVRVGRDKYLDEHTVRLKLARHEYYKVMHAIRTGGDYDFHSSPLPWLTSICKLVFAHGNPNYYREFDLQAVINRATGMQLQRRKS